MGKKEQIQGIEEVEKNDLSAEKDGSDGNRSMRQEKGVKKEQIAHRVSVKEVDNEKREIVGEGIEESQGEVQDNPPSPTAHPTLDVRAHNLW